MPYRDELEALESRRANLTEELDRVDVELERLRGLEKRRERVARELHDVQHLLEGKRSLLDGIRVASPCRARWEAMEGDGPVRRCHACAKRVFDVSGMSRPEATHLLVAHAGEQICVRLRRREDGTLVSGDCPLGRRLRRRGRVLVTGGTAAVVGATMLAGATATMGGLDPRSLPAELRDPNAVDGAPAAWKGDDHVDVTLAPPEPRRNAAAHEVHAEEADVAPKRPRAEKDPDADHGALLERICQREDVDCID